MARNQGAILNLLQWQNQPTSSSVRYNRRFTSGDPHFKSTDCKIGHISYTYLINFSVERNFVRENIQRVRMPKISPIAVTPSSHISDSINAGTGTVDMYLGAVDRDQSSEDMKNYCENGNQFNQQKKPLTSDIGTQTELQNDKTVNCRFHKSPPKRSGFLRAHEKTGQLNAMMSLSEIPVKKLIRTPQLTRISVPRASSAKDVKFTRRNLNYVRANANAVSNGCVVDRRSTNRQSMHPPSAQSRSFGRLPPYLSDLSLVSYNAEYTERERQQPERGLKKEAQRLKVTEECQKKKEKTHCTPLKRVSYAKTLDEITRAPTHIPTTCNKDLRAQQEDRLSDLKEVIRAFRKPVVFITLD
ncbi:unnamed protein product [Hydatigera taeniaeformis]|uniref:Enkurin domain-containing protein n=1 Tax=Hydatigena taeniaeformis TaxID=6205 RepID=A0A0R3X1R5_HYDTA|nr:unnamed protein product [Hydatigera taeniaeformis]